MSFDQNSYQGNNGQYRNSQYGNGQNSGQYGNSQYGNGQNSDQYGNIQYGNSYFNNDQYNNNYNNDQNVRNQYGVNPAPGGFDPAMSNGNGFAPAPNGGNGGNNGYQNNAGSGGNNGYQNNAGNGGNNGYQNNAGNGGNNGYQNNAGNGGGNGYPNNAGNGGYRGGNGYPNNAGNGNGRGNGYSSYRGNGGYNGGGRRNYSGNDGDAFRFHIVEYIGVLNEKESGWKKEVNLVEWNGNAAKIDVREWDRNHEKMSRGVTLFEEEAEKLALALCKRYGIVTGHGSSYGMKKQNSSLYDDMPDTEDNSVQQISEPTLLFEEDSFAAMEDDIPFEPAAQSSPALTDPLPPKEADESISVDISSDSRDIPFNVPSASEEKADINKDADAAAAPDKMPEPEISEAAQTEKDIAAPETASKAKGGAESARRTKKPGQAVDLQKQ